MTQKARTWNGMPNPRAATPAAASAPPANMANTRLSVVTSMIPRTTAATTQIAHVQATSTC